MRKTRTAHMAQEATYANPESMQSQCELCWTNAEHMRNLLSEALCLCCLPIRILQDTTGSSSSSGYFWNQHLWFLQIEQLINFCRILLESASVVLANWTTYQLLYHKQKNDLAILQIIYQSHSGPGSTSVQPDGYQKNLSLLCWSWCCCYECLLSLIQESRNGSSSLPHAQPTMSTCLIMHGYQTKHQKWLNWMALADLCKMFITLSKESEKPLQWHPTMEIFHHPNKHPSSSTYS